METHFPSLKSATRYEGANKTKKAFFKAQSSMAKPLSDPNLVDFSDANPKTSSSIFRSLRDFSCTILRSSRSSL